VSSLPDRSLAKSAAIEQWTADPCGPEVAAEPGTATYIEQLVAGRHQYAPWFAEALGYAGTARQRVLDVGCGQGIDLVQYAAAGARVTGIDLTPRHAELAERHLAALGLEGEVVVGDAESLPFPDSGFDRVSSNGVLHHTPDIEQALREIRRVLRPGGEVRVLLYNRRSFHYWLFQVIWQGLRHRQLFEEGSMAGVLSRGVERSSVGARPLVRVYTPRQVRRLLRGAGFTKVRTRVGVFNAIDTPITDVLARHTRLFEGRRLKDLLGSVGGWYVLGTGTR
jgi:ubiquinone/menaquinone biosynthesis C-methylase UbiE